MNQANQQVPEPLGELSEAEHFLLPRGSNGAQAHHNLAPLIAFVGCDGAGKTTVSEAICAWLQESRATQSCHLGIQSKALGESLCKLPLVGGMFARLIKSNVPNETAGIVKSNDGPTTLVAIATFLLSLRRWRRYQKMMKLRRIGITVVADRFPQIAVPQIKVDGPGLAYGKCRNALVRFLAARERTLYDYMISHRPDVVIRLNVDLATAFARKPDHRYSSLEQKIAQVAKLEYQGAPSIDLDSREPLAVVIAQAKQAIAHCLQSR